MTDIQWLRDQSAWQLEAINRQFGHLKFKRKEWTDATIDAVRQAWFAGHSAVTIARFTGFTKNAIVGKAHRLGFPKRSSPILPLGSRKPQTLPVPKSTPPPLPSDPSGLIPRQNWYTGDTLPAWGTPEADSIVAEAKDRLISTYKIAHLFGVSDNSVDCALRRAMVLREADRLSVASATPAGPFVPFATKEWPLETLIAVADLWNRGLTHRKIAGQVGKTYAGIQKKVQKLQHAGLLAKREAGSTEFKEPVEKRERLPRPVLKPKPAAEIRTPQSVISYRGYLPFSGMHKAPSCLWSGCKEVPVGKWCHSHGDLLRAPAVEISQRLGEWK